jgi:hypothetical protein
VAQAGVPWEENWSTKAGDCVGVKQLPGISCKLFSNGIEGFNILVHIDDKIATKYAGSDVFFDTGKRLCVALGAPVSIEIYINSTGRKMRATLAPPVCATAVTVAAPAKS